MSKDTEGGENLGCLGNSLGRECRGRGARWWMKELRLRMLQGPHHEKE